MSPADIDGYWDIVVTSLQDICSSNESLTFENIYGKHLQESDAQWEKKSPEELRQLQDEVQDHRSNIETVKRLVGTSQQNLQTLISFVEKRNAANIANVSNASRGGGKKSGKGGKGGKASIGGKAGASTKFHDEIDDNGEEEDEDEVPLGGRNDKNSKKGVNHHITAANTRSSSKSSGMMSGSGNDADGDGDTDAGASAQSRQGGKMNNLNKLKNTKKSGRSFYTSKFNPSEPIYKGSEVAYKLKNRHFEEWIQCEVMRVIGDGIKFEIRDPEPDENNNPGQTFRANYKEILLIPRVEVVPDLASYPYGTKVLARYPETTTFYPAIVVGEKKDGSVRLKFDGEEEVNKETEVERRLALPFPER